MTIQKDCADHLRQCLSATGATLRAGHAHELVAAFFGYGTGAALRAERAYPLEKLSEADILVPDVLMLHQRTQDIPNLPHKARDIDAVVTALCSFLNAQRYFNGEIWRTENLPEYVRDIYLPTHHMLTVMDDLSGEMAETNASFDSVDFDTASLEIDCESVIVNVTGVLEGDTDLDRPFSGDTINFTCEVTFYHVASRIGYRAPEIRTSGSVDGSHYDGD